MTADDKPRRHGRSGRTSRADELRAMSVADYIAVEGRLRKMADRQRLQLVKARRRGRGTAHGRYMLLDPYTSAVVTGGDWSLDLADVEETLLGVVPGARRHNAHDCPICGSATYTLSGLIKGARVDERECPECCYMFNAAPTPPPQADWIEPDTERRL